LLARKKSVAPEEAEDGDDRHSEEDLEDATVSPASLKKRKINSKGLVVLGNGTVSMRDLDLASRVPIKIKDDGADKLFNASLTLSKAFTLFTLIIHGKNLPIEKVRDETHHLILLRSAAPYCLSKETLDTILGPDPGVSVLYSLYQCPQFSNLAVAGISCSWSWTRWFVLSWPSTLRCQYGTPPAKRPWTNCSMPTSMCK
jgi:hypothetical protein